MAQDARPDDVSARMLPRDALLRVLASNRQAAGLSRVPFATVVRDAGAEAGPHTVRHAEGGHTAPPRSVSAASPEPRPMPDLPPAPAPLRDASAAPMPAATAIINATGVPLGPDVTRLPLAPAAIEAARGAARSETRPLPAPERQLCALAGAGDAVILSDAPAALTIALAALAGPKGEIVIARSDLIETPEGIRVEQLIRASGARIRETGASNAVTAEDYRAALGPATRVLLQLPPTPTRGNAQPPKLEDLARIARLQGAVVVRAFAGGALFANPFEPTMRECLEQGADIVIAAGDRLIGGPACGIVVGGRDAMAPILRLARTTRLPPDRMVMAALSATLAIQARGEAACRDAIPLWRLLGQDRLLLEERAQRLLGLLAGLDATIVATDIAPGPGSWPGADAAPSSTRHPESRAVSVAAPGRDSARLAATLLRGDPAIACGRARDRILLDVLTLDDDELGRCAGAVRAAVERAPQAG